MGDKPLPFAPEPIDKLKARLMEAISEPLKAQDVFQGKAVAPGFNRTHVFDFESGVRMILTYDYLSEDKTALHASISDPSQNRSAEELKELAYENLKSIGWPCDNKADAAMLGTPAIHLMWIKGPPNKNIVRLWSMASATKGEMAIALFKDDEVLRWAKTENFDSLEYGIGEKYGPPAWANNAIESGNKLFDHILSNHRSTSGKKLIECSPTEFNLTAFNVMGRI